MRPPYDGGCFCGAVRYRLTEEPLTLYACHCTDCQRRSGGAFGLSMFVARNALQVLSGEPDTMESMAPNGTRRRGKYCGKCATRLWGEPAKLPDIAILRPGTLDDTKWLRPVAHIWVRSKQPWVQIPDDALVFETQAGDYRILINAWRERRAVG